MFLKKICLFVVLFIVTNQINTSIENRKNMLEAYNILKNQYNNLITQKYTDINWGIGATIAIPVLAYGTKKIYDYWDKKEKEISKLTRSIGDDRPATLGLMQKSFYFSCTGIFVFLTLKAIQLSSMHFAFFLTAVDKQKIMEAELFHLMQKIH